MASLKVKVVSILILLFSLTGCLNPKLYQVAFSDDTVKQALGMAQTRLGSAYEYGGQGPDVFDCSGLIVWAYQQVIPNLQFRVGSQRVSDVNMDDLWRYNVQVISADQMKPGDVVFITSEQDRITHGGLFVRWLSPEEFEFTNASSNHDNFGVVETAWPINSSLRGQWFAGAGRVLQTY